MHGELGLILPHAAVLPRLQSVRGSQRSELRGIGKKTTRHHYARWEQFRNGGPLLLGHAVGLLEIEREVTARA